MEEREFTVPHETKRYDLPFAIVSAAFWLGVLIWYGPALGLPWVYGNPGNLFGIGLLIGFSILLLYVSLMFVGRLIYEIKAARVSTSQCILRYRYLGERLAYLPFHGKVLKRVRIPDIRTEKGYREAILVYRGTFERILIPNEMDGAAELAALLSAP